MPPARAKPSVVSAKSAMGSSAKVSTPSETTRVVGPKPSIASSARASPASVRGVVGARREGQVEGRARAPPAAALVRVAGEVRVGPVRVAVQRHVLDVVALVEDLLGAVAVVVVDVEDADPGPGRAGDVVSDDGRVVEVAVAAVGRPRCVVAGRPAEPVRSPGTVEHEVGSPSARRRPPPGPPDRCRRRAGSSSRSTSSRGGRRRHSGPGAAPMPSRRAGWTKVSGKTSASSCSSWTCSQAEARKATRPGSCTASIGATPCSTGATKGNRSGSPASARRISSARTGSSYWPSVCPSSTSDVGAWPWWMGE